MGAKDNRPSGNISDAHEPAQLRLSAYASLHLVDDGGVLLDPKAQRIYRLDETSALIWCCLAEGWSEEGVRALLTERHDMPPDRADEYVATALANWRDLELLGDPRQQEPAGTVIAKSHRSVSETTPPPPMTPLSTTADRRSYRILDSNIELSGLPESLLVAIDAALGELASTQHAQSPTICTLVADDDGYVLIEGARLVDRCAALEAVVPMIKAALLGVAIEQAEVFAIVHAAAVCREGRAVILPGPAGTGKSMLAADLLLDGWSMAADDVTILGPDASRVRPLPVSVCLKAPGWAAMAAKVPNFDRLASHLREDGQWVRYLRPWGGRAAAAGAASVPVGLIAFPRYQANESLSVRPLTAGQAFDRLLPQFYPVSNRFDREIIDRLLSLLKQVKVVELCYGDPDAALDAIGEWAA